MSSIDNIIPEDKWEFDESVAKCFLNMLSRSIPQYEVMRDLSAQLVADIVNDNFKILDLGCSDGLMILALDKYLKKTNGQFIGVDVSEPMLNKARNIFSNYTSRIVIENCDLRYDFPKDNYDAITSILTLQFIPIEYRQKIIQNVYDNLIEGGVFIFVEKILGNNNQINELFVKNYYRLKEHNGYTKEQIESKRQSLEGVLVPLTDSSNKELLYQAGFKTVDTFWKWCNFTGYIVIK